MNLKSLKQLGLLASMTMLASSALPALSDTPSVASQADQDMLVVGAKAPGFQRTSSDGHKVSLKSFRGKKAVVLYFYPKDGTKGCTAEACLFRDDYQVLKDKGAEVIGVSGDSDDSHKSFARDNQLPFDLIADSDNSLMKLYHVPAFKGTMHSRVTFLIDKKGVIQMVFVSLPDAQEHVKRALAALDKINGSK